MRIAGLNRLTLLDYPEKVAATVFLGGCNLRCPFCHNAALAHDVAQEIPEDEVLCFLEKRRGVLDGVCVSGGEPLLQPDLAAFLARVKELSYTVKLDTNGCFPERLKDIVSSKLVDYVAMDIKSAPDAYQDAVGVQGFDTAPVLESVSFLLSGEVDYEFRSTVARGLHTEALLIGAARAIRGAKRYYLQQFVDSGDLIGEGLSPFPEAEMRAFLAAVSPYVEQAALRGI